ncbi:MAG: type II secretion system protein N [Gammaproteobacteria bacterium]|nr:MAG: type II secretion system protein N [Gammaproteobacteria bacterium]
MKLAHRHWLVIAGGLAFLVFLLAGVPARVAVRWLAPPAVQFTDLSGTLWRGSVTNAVAGPLRLGPLSWDLSPLALLTGRVRLDIDARLGAGQARGRVDLGAGGRFACSRCSYEGPAASLRGLVPSLQGLAGQLRLDFTSIELRDRWPTRVVGTVALTDVPLRAPGSPPLPGVPTTSFNASVTADPVPEDGQIEAMLQDAGGPLQVTGRLVMTPPGNYQLDARIKARPDAPAQLVNALATLGPRGPDGSTDIGMSGSF